MNLDDVKTLHKLNIIHHRASILRDHAIVDVFRRKRDRFPAIVWIVTVNNHKSFNIIKDFCHICLRYEHLLVSSEWLEICIDSTDPPDLAAQNKQANESRAIRNCPQSFLSIKIFLEKLWNYLFDMAAALWFLPTQLHRREWNWVTCCGARSKMIRAVMMMPNWPNPPSTAKNNSGCLLGEQITSSPFPDKNTTCESLNISPSLNFSDGVPRIERKPFWFNEGTACKCTCDNFKLQYVADFRAVSKRLSTNAGIGKGPANAEIEIVGPGPWSQTFLQCRFEHINPKLASGCIHVGHWAICISLWHHLDPAKCRHFDNDSIQSLQTDHNVEITQWEAKKAKTKRYTLYWLACGRTAVNSLSVCDPLCKRSGELPVPAH